MHAVKYFSPHDETVYCSLENNDLIVLLDWWLETHARLWETVWKATEEDATSSFAFQTAVWKARLWQDLFESYLSNQVRVTLIRGCPLDSSFISLEEMDSDKVLEVYLDGLCQN